MPGRGGATRELAEEAGERLVRQGARTADDLEPVVIGETMKRVTKYASRRGYKTIGDFVSDAAWESARREGGFEAMMNLNREWIEQMMREGRRVIDIGPHFGRRWRRYLAGETPASPFYELERRLTKDYTNYEKRFKRFGKWRGRAF